MPCEPINATQIKLIHIAKSQLKMGEDNYRGMLHAWYKVESSKALTYDQASALIDEMKKLGFKLKTKREAPPASGCPVCAPRPSREEIPDNTIYLVSPQQLRKIEHLRDDIRWKTWDGYNRWLKKYFGIDRIKNSLEASEVIEGLKGLWRSQNHCSAKNKKTCSQSAGEQHAG